MYLTIFSFIIYRLDFGFSMNTSYEYGYLEIILGPMFSGKTSRLIQLERMYSLCDMSICIVNYAEDQRYDSKKMSTHDKQMIDCYQAKTLDIIDDECIRNHDVFLINEAQFFDSKDLIHTVHSLVDTHKKIVYLAGLDGTFEQKPFTGMGLLYLIPYADNVIKLQSICKHCKVHKAPFTRRTSLSKKEKLIGVDEYIAVCRKCLREPSVQV